MATVVMVIKMSIIRALLKIATSAEQKVKPKKKEERKYANMRKKMC